MNVSTSTESELEVHRQGGDEGGLTIVSLGDDVDGVQLFDRFFFFILVAESSLLDAIEQDSPSILAQLDCKSVYFVKFVPRDLWHCHRPHTAIGARQQPWCTTTSICVFCRRAEGRDLESSIGLALSPRPLPSELALFFSTRSP